LDVEQVEVVGGTLEAAKYCTAAHGSEGRFSTTIRVYPGSGHAVWFQISTFPQCLLLLLVLYVFDLI
jgi:hypothetical protein